MKDKEGGGQKVLNGKDKKKVDSNKIVTIFCSI